MELSKKQIILKTYNKSAQQLAKYFKSIGPRKKDIDQAFSYVKKGATVLEIGCGDGRDAEYILTQTKEYSGFDLSGEIIELAKKRLPEKHFFVADTEKYFLKKKLKKYDIIFSFASLLHSKKSVVVQIIKNANKRLYKGEYFLSH